MKLINLFTLLALLAPSFQSLQAAIEPSQAFSTALNVAELDVREKAGLTVNEGFRVFEVNAIGIGKFDKGRFGDYTVVLSLFKEGDTTDVRKCTVGFSIRKVSFAMQPPGVRILEEVVNQHQIIVPQSNVNCIGSLDPVDSFAVTTPGMMYAIVSQKNGFLGNNPELTLVRGKTYLFNVNAPAFHPFELTSDEDGQVPFNNGVTNNNINKGTIKFTVPANAPDTLFYRCSVHFFGSKIHITN